MENVDGVSLFNWPDETTPLVPNWFQNVLIELPVGKVALATRRQAGTTLGMALLAAQAIFFSSSRVMYVAPSEGMARSFWNDYFNPLLNSTSWALREVTHHYHSTRTIRTTTGGMLTVKGGRQLEKSGALCGVSADQLFIDGADYLEKDTWRALAPIMAGSIGRRPPDVLVAGNSPEHSPSPVWQALWGNQHSHWHYRHIPASANPDLSPQRLQAIKASTNSELEWEQEWEATLP